MSRYTLLPSTLSPPTCTVTSFFGLIGFNGLVTVLVFFLTLLTIWAAVFFTT